MVDKLDWVAQEKGVYTKTQTIPASSLIPVGGNNFQKMTDASQLSSLEASAPAFHRSVLNALKAAGKVREDEKLVEMMKGRREQVTEGPRMGFRTGSPVIDKQGRKLTIIHARAGHTK